MRTARHLAAAFLAFAMPAAAQLGGACDKNHYILESPHCEVLGSEVGIGEPHAVAAGPDREVYFAVPNTVFKVTREGLLMRVAGNGAPGSGGDGGPAIDAQLNFPETYEEMELDLMDYDGTQAVLAADAMGNLVIGDVLNLKFRVVGRDGRIRTLAEGGWPYAAASGLDGFLYTTDQSGVRRIAPDGAVAYLPPTRYVPMVHAVDPQGSLYIPMGHVQRVTRSGFTLRIAGCFYDETDCTLADGVPALQARLSATSLALDPAGQLYVANPGQHCVRKVDLEGRVTTVAGKCAQGGSPEHRGFSGDGGPATQARLDQPTSIALGPDGSLFIADKGNKRVRKVDSRGIITTVAGNGGWIRGPDLVPEMAAPAAVAAGASFEATVATRNEGQLLAAPSLTRYILSRSFWYRPDGDVLLGELAVGALAAGSAEARTVTLHIPAEVTPGDYVVIAHADAGRAVTESREINNLRSWRIRVTAP